MLLAIHDGDDDETIAQFEGRGDGAFEAMFDTGLDQEAVDNQLDAVILTLVESDGLVQAHDLAVNPSFDEALAEDFLELLAEFPFAPAHHGGEDHDALVFAKSHNLFEDLGRRLAADLAAAERAVRDAGG